MYAPASADPRFTKPDSNAGSDSDSELVFRHPDTDDPRLEKPDPDPEFEKPDSPAPATATRLKNPDTRPAPVFSTPEPPPAPVLKNPDDATVPVLNKPGPAAMSRTVSVIGPVLPVT